MTKPSIPAQLVPDEWSQADWKPYSWRPQGHHPRTRGLSVARVATLARRVLAVERARAKRSRPEVLLSLFQRGRARLRTVGER